MAYQLIRVPQDCAGRYAGLTWSELVAVAESGTDGLLLTHASEYPKNYFNHITKPDGFAYFREGDRRGLLEGRASLFFQGF